MREFKFRAWDKKKNKMWTRTHNNLSIKLEGYLDTNDDRTERDFELMQYTGIKDRTGKEVYEGDILEIRGEYPFIVEYVLGAFTCTGEEGIKYFYENATEGCVIGNIYENPELTEEMDEIDPQVREAIKNIIEPFIEKELKQSRKGYSKSFHKEVDNLWEKYEKKLWEEYEKN